MSLALQQTGVCRCGANSAAEVSGCLAQGLDVWLRGIPFPLVHVGLFSTSVLRLPQLDSYQAVVQVQRSNSSQPRQAF